MAKKNARSADRHKPRYMVPLPIIYRQQLDKLFEKHRRPATEEVKIALEQYLAQFNLWPPKADA